ncbi:MAG: DUF3429 domain-containing protein [Pseudomonadota bacterium]
MDQQQSGKQTGLMPGVPGPARWLGLAGLIPFAAGAIATWVLEPPFSILARDMLAVYGAVILSFMGGCRWGFAAAGLGSGPGWLPLATSVAPAIFGWITVFSPHPQPFFYLSVGFAALLGADLLLTKEGGAPDWWPSLRWPLTAGVIASLSAAGFA